ncbi:hypothetical protein K461DRAFT_264564 [Myriangium duriaei CBS 260.36]|uniref:Uncharacterized protein n=1 Tax=Myriangium duriaei CBS 260.36 TaxID=1168546 RepID=A0A9P4J9T9_9PEZI|nr:hypothetical protein K461DRAFT_264564 [Myriangium duriaei CBS 260.36]
MTALSANDSRVLSALFDPESSPSNAISISTSDTLPGLTHKECATLQSQEAAILAALDTASPTPDQIRSTHAAISDLIQRNPRYAPAYIDRAQIARLTLQTSDLFTAQHEAASRQLLSDLAQGIDLASPSAPSDAVSALQSRILAAAHTHRGLLLLKVADMRTRGEAVHGVGEAVGVMEAMDIEGLASKDFYMGGRYGNKIAQQLAVKTNPYAKMCGAIVKEAIQKEIEEAEGGLRDGFGAGA